MARGGRGHMAPRGPDLPRPRDLEVTYTPQFTDIVHELRGHIGALRKPTSLASPQSPVEIAQ